MNRPKRSAAVRGDAARGVMQAAEDADQFIIFEVPSPPVAAPPASRKRARQAAPKIERNLDLNHSAREEGLDLLLTLAQCFSSMLPMGKLTGGQARFTMPMVFERAIAD